MKRADDPREIAKDPKQNLRVNEYQMELLASFRDQHLEGLKSPPYYTPFGTSPLSLCGAGQPMAGLLKRGMIEERNRLFYITPLGLAAYEANDGQQVRAILENEHDD